METLTHQQESLEDILHHFLTLNERWSDDRQAMAKQNAELGKLVVRLSAQLEKLKEAGELLKRQVTHHIENAAHTMAREAAGEFKKLMLHDVEAVIDVLKKSSDEASRQLQVTYQDYRRSNVTAMIALFTLPIMVSLLIFWWLSPKPLLALTDQQMSTYQAGKFLEDVWPKLNKKQQRWLNDVVNGKIKNHGAPLDELSE